MGAAWRPDLNDSCIRGASLDSMTLFTDGATPPMIADAGRAVAADHAHFCLGVELTLSKIT